MYLFCCIFNVFRLKSIIVRAFIDVAFQRRFVYFFLFKRFSHGIGSGIYTILALYLIVSFGGEVIMVYLVNFRA